MQIPFVGFQPVRTSEHMASAGVFLLLNAYAFLKYLQNFMSRSDFKMLFFGSISAIAGLVFLGVVLLTYAGYIAPWSGRFYSLWGIIQFHTLHIVHNLLTVLCFRHGLCEDSYSDHCFSFGASAHNLVFVLFRPSSIGSYISYWTVVLHQAS